MYHKSDLLLLSNVFENFRQMFLEIYHSDLAKVLSATELAWEAIFKKAEVKLEFLTNTDMLLNNFNGGAMSQKLSLNNLKGVDDICKFDESIIKMYNNVFLNLIFNT